MGGSDSRLGLRFLSTFRHTAMGDSGPLTLVSIVLAVVVGGVLLMMFVERLYFASGASKLKGVSLPKGSLGWPIVGESLKFSSDPQAYTASHVKAYGSVFKSSLFLRRTILGTTPEFAKFVATNSKLLPHTLPEHLASFMGRKSLLNLNGSPHLSLKKIIMKSIGPDAIRNQVRNFENIILKNLASWERAGTVVGIEATQKLSWDASNWVLFGDEDSTATAQGRQNFENFKLVMKMLISLPVNLPGTHYSNGMKAKADLREHFMSLIKQAKNRSTAATEGVFYTDLLRAREDPEGPVELKEFDDDAISDNYFLLNFTAYDTNSTTLVWVLKFLIDYPDVFRRIRAEQLEILNSKDPSVQGPRLAWEDMKKMVYTQKFLREVQRFVSLIPLGFAEATEDVKFGTHLIPKGWLVITLTNAIHNDPANYPDLSFNPDRFDVNPKPFSYLPYSSGPHMCPGIEMAKLIGCIAIHHITTTYTHESVAPDKGVEYDGFFPKPRGGYPVKLRTRK